MTGKTKYVFIADNHYLVTDALIRIIQAQENLVLSGLAENKAMLHLHLSNKNAIDLLITDPHQFDYSGSGDLNHIKISYPETNILILTNQVNVNEINELNRIGIKNIIYKTTGLSDLLHAIDQTLNGKKFYSEEVLDLLTNSKAERDEIVSPALLTPTETEVTRLIANGLTTKEIASQKHVSYHTVMSHRKNIFRKLHVKNTSELTMYAVKAGLIDNIEYYI